MSSQHTQPSARKSDAPAPESTPPHTDVFALDNVTQLRQAVDQAVYGEDDAKQPDDPERAHTVETLTTLGQMGILTEMDIDEAKKGYL